MAKVCIRNANYLRQESYLDQEIDLIPAWYIACSPMLVTPETDATTSTIHKMTDAREIFRSRVS